MEPGLSKKRNVQFSCIFWLLLLLQNKIERNVVATIQKNCRCFRKKVVTIELKIFFQILL